MKILSQPSQIVVVVVAVGFCLVLKALVTLDCMCYGPLLVEFALGLELAAMEICQTTSTHRIIKSSESISSLFTTFVLWWHKNHTPNEANPSLVHRGWTSI